MGLKIPDESIEVLTRNLYIKDSLIDVFFKEN